MNITRLDQPIAHKTGNITNFTVDEVTQVLGFRPNVSIVEFPVEHCWSASVDGHHIAIWDWRGSSTFGQFSCYGPDEIMEKLFGVNYISYNEG